MDKIRELGALVFVVELISILLKGVGPEARGARRLYNTEGRSFKKLKTDMDISEGGMRSAGGVKLAAASKKLSRSPNVAATPAPEPSRSLGWGTNAVVSAEPTAVDV